MVSQCIAVCRIDCLASGPVLFTVSVVVPEQVVFGLEGLSAPRYLCTEGSSLYHIAAPLGLHLKCESKADWALVAQVLGPLHFPVQYRATCTKLMPSCSNTW